MTVVLHDCGWSGPHAAHAYPVVHPDVPTLVTTLSCRGTQTGPQPRHRPTTQAPEPTRPAPEPAQNPAQPGTPHPTEPEQENRT